jgi:pilus assembly protein CpaC
MLPNVPVRGPRPAEGNEAGQQWQIEVDPATPPTAGFIEALRGNDAVIQLIVGQARLLTLKADLADERGAGAIAVGDPSIMEFDDPGGLVNPRVLRIRGLRPGVTDLTLVTPDGQAFIFEVHVGFDIVLLQAKLHQVFPDAQLRLFHIREHLAVEGQARSIRQVDQIQQTLEAYLDTEHILAVTDRASGARGTRRDEAAGRGTAKTKPSPDGVETDVVVRDESRSTVESEELTTRTDQRLEAVKPRIINLLRVPGVHQVMLQVQIAELNRTALRNIGADWRWEFGAGNILQTLIGGDNTTVTGVFPSANLEVVLRALRMNSLISVLAEPNVVAMSGQKAEFLAGGEIPIPMSTVTGGTTNISIEWRQYGVTLEFLPYVLEDETIRLTVTPEESTLDYANALLIEGLTIPATTNRRVSTTVEMRQGQTLALAGLLRVAIDANTKRIPGLGDLPYIGPLFSNTTHSRQEKELLVLVTPYLVAPMNPDEVPCLPTDGITDPNDLEFYLLNRIEGRTGREFYPTREWDDPWGFRYLMHLEQSNCCGPVGFSPME